MIRIFFIVSFLIFSLGARAADKPIWQLPPAPPLTGAELAPVDVPGITNGVPTYTTSKTTLSAIAAFGVTITPSLPSAPSLTGNELTIVDVPSIVNGLTVYTPSNTTLNAIAALANQSPFGGVLFPAVNYGLCNWTNGAVSAGNDVGPCVNAAYAACAADGGGTILIPGGSFGQATTIANHANGCKMQAQGTSYPRPNGQTPPLAVTQFIWNGARGGGSTAPMFLLTSNTNIDLQNVDTVGVSFNCNSVCDYSAVISDVAYSNISIQWSNPVVTGLWLTTSSGAYAQNGFGTQNNHFTLVGNCTDGNLSTCFLRDGQGASPNYFDVSNNDFDLISIYSNNGDGFIDGYQDHNLDHFVQIHILPTGTGIPEWHAGSVYTMLNGLQTHSNIVFPYNKVFKNESPLSAYSGTRTGSSITPNSANSCNGGGPTACGTTTITLTTNAVTNIIPVAANRISAETLNFASTTGIAAGLTVTSGVGLQGGVVPNNGIDAVTATTAQMHYPAVFKQIQSGANIVFSYGTTPTTSPGTYTITAVDATHFNISGSAGLAGYFPAGNSQTNVAAVNGVVTFQDLVWPITGTPTAGDNWSFVVPQPTLNADYTYTDAGGNSPSIVYFEIGAGGTFRSEKQSYSTIEGTYASDISIGYACGQSDLYGNAGNITISAANTQSCSNNYGATSIIVGGANSQWNSSSTNDGMFSCVNCVGTGATNFATGSNQTISGTHVFESGHLHIGSGYDSELRGDGASDRTRRGSTNWASGYFAVAGDAQISYGVMRGSGSGATAFNLETDGGGSNNTTNCWNIPANTDYALTVQAAERDYTTPGAAITWGGWVVLLHRASTLGSTSVTTATLPTPVSVGTTTGATVSLAADTSFGCLTAKLTPPSANTTDVWHGAISVTSLELQ